jgi:hypothetical protein
MSGWIRRRRSRLVFLLGLALAAGATIATAALAYSSRFVATYCNYSNPSITSSFTRQAAIDWAYVARWEGYQWGGGCWNNNNHDDSPGDPPGDPNAGGEGGDCSGFTFKSWRESPHMTDNRFWLWDKFRNVHGPYSASSFNTGAGNPNVTYSKSGLIRMDALASSTHVGMIYAKNANGTDQIIEAKGEAYGTNIWTRSYRMDPRYGGVRRLGWTG